MRIASRLLASLVVVRLLGLPRLDTLSDVGEPGLFAVSELTFRENFLRPTVEHEVRLTHEPDELPGDMVALGG